MVDVDTVVDVGNGGWTTSRGVHPCLMSELLTMASHRKVWKRILCLSVPTPDDLAVKELNRADIEEVDVDVRRERR